MFKIIQSGGFLSKTLGNMMSNFMKKALLDFVAPLANDVLPQVATKATLSDKFEKIISRQEVVRATVRVTRKIKSIN